MSDPFDLSKSGDARADEYQTVMCPRCGRDIPIGSAKCPDCGADLGAAAFQAAPQSDTPDRWGLVRFASGLLLGLLAALLLAYLRVR
jgi:hypothetical protein